MREISSIIQGGSEWDIRDRVSRTLSDSALNRIINGDNLAAKFAAEIAGFSSVWAWIQNRIRTGNFEDINVGDFISFTAGGNTVLAEVAGINTYTRYGSPVESEVGNHIDFISRDCWPDTIQWNLVNYNNGLASMPSPYLVSNVHAFINSLQMAVPNGTGADPATTTVDYRNSGIFALLPAALQNVIVSKVTVLERRYAAGILLTNSNSGDWREIGPLWIPSEIEVYGTTMWGGTEGQNQGWDSYGFQQYPIFAQNMKRVKGNGHNGARHGWWLLTARGGFSIHAAYVGIDGHAGRYFTSNATRRVPVCFRIA